MKRYRLPSVLLVMLVLLGSCSFPEQPYWLVQPWLCSINADGTGFRKIKKAPFNTPGLTDIYMTKDDRIIFYGQKLWISDTDTIRVEQITPDNITLWHLPSRLSQSPDGGKLYFAADKNIYQLSYPDYQLTMLTDQTVRWLRNPIVSDLGNYIIYSSNGFGYPTKETDYLFCMSLQSGQSNIIPTDVDSVVVNGFYSEVENFVYYQGVGVKKSRLDGNDLSIVASDGRMYPDTTFGSSSDLRYLIYIVPDYPTRYVNYFDKQLDTVVHIQLPVKNSVHNRNNDLARISAGANRIFYVNPVGSEKLCVYNLDTGADRVLLQDTDKIIYSFINIAPTWDGSKVYFYADIAENIGG